HLEQVGHLAAEHIVEHIHLHSDWTISKRNTHGDQPPVPPTLECAESEHSEPPVAGTIRPCPLQTPPPNRRTARRRSPPCARRVGRCSGCSPSARSCRATT